MSEITQLLNAMQLKSGKSVFQLQTLVYEELRALARAKMAREAPGHTLQPTALVHEAWLRLDPDKGRVWENRAHFFGAASEAMRRILVESARRRLAKKRGAGYEHVDADEFDVVAPNKQDDDIVAIHEALERFAEEHPEKAELVKLRYFVGMSLLEAGEALGIAPRTGKRWWAYARAWLKTETGL